MLLCITLALNTMRLSCLSEGTVHAHVLPSRKMQGRLRFPFVTCLGLEWHMLILVLRLLQQFVKPLEGQLAAAILQPG